MKLPFGLVLINNRKGEKVVIDIKRRVSVIYSLYGNEAAYAAYRTITSASVQKSWWIVKPWIREWGGK
jgi:hypothetical protein